jgi:ATP-binding cassette subfamily B protein
MSKYILKNIHWFALSTAITIVTTFINIYIPTLSGQAVKDILSIGDFEMLKGLVIQILVLTGGLCLFSLIRSSAYGFFTQKVVFDVRNDVFKSIQRQSFGFFDKMKTGQLMSRATTDVERIRGFVGFQLRMLTDSIFLLGAVIASMVIINLDLSLLAFSTVPVLFFVNIWFGKKIRPIMHTAREQFGALTSVLWENITGIRVVRSFAREDYEKQKFRKPNTDYYSMMLKSVKLQAFFQPFQGLFFGLVTVAIFWLGGIQIIGNRFTIDQLFVFSIYISMLIRPIGMLGMIISSYQTMAAAAERVFEIIDAVPEVRDKPDATTLPAIKGQVVFENVSFGYDKDKPILKNIVIEAKPGETIALLGPTGSGKSTIIRLLPRFYDVTSGRILVDGFDVRDVKAESLRKQMGIVSQETFLFNMTVKQNIAYGMPNATMEDIEGVAKIAKAHEFITQLPNGYDTIIGERGVTLSGGQQQRVAIARALLMNPRILILDDSTSSVDVDTEYEIQQALSALLKNRTTFVVTQRLSTIRNADKIVVLDDGQVVEEGDHESLMAKKGAYYRIYETLYEAQKEALEPKKARLNSRNDKKEVS